MFFISGLSGAFFQPLVVSYGLAVLASLLVALTVTPALAYILLRNAPIERQRSPITRRLQDAYAALITRILRTTRPAFLTVGAVSMIGLAIWPQLGQSLLPDFKERDFLMHWVTAPGTSIGEETRITIDACNELRAIPGVRNCGSHIGQAFVADEPYGVEFGENWISIDPAVDYDKTHAAVLEVVNGYPGLRRDVQTYLKERIREVLTGSSDAIVVRVYGPDLGKLKELAEDDRGEDRRHPRHHRPPYRAARRHRRRSRSRSTWPPRSATASSRATCDVSPRPIWRAKRSATSSTPARPTTSSCGACRRARASVTDVENLLIDTATGGKVALKTIADVTVAPTAGHVSHEQTARRIHVDANVSGRDLGAVVADVQAAIDQTQFPQGYHPELLGEFQERQKAQDRLLLFAIVAAIGVFLLLQASFGSTRLAILSFLTLPSALVGGILAAWLGVGRHLARRARRVLHGPRHRGPERDHDDQPLPAPREATRARSSDRRS